jgi:hypothetical protein
MRGIADIAADLELIAPHQRRERERRAEIRFVAERSHPSALARRNFHQGPRIGKQGRGFIALLLLPTGQEAQHGTRTARRAQHPLPVIAQDGALTGFRIDELDRAEQACQIYVEQDLQARLHENVPAGDRQEAGQRDAN